MTWKCWRSRRQSKTKPFGKTCMRPPQGMWRCWKWGIDPKDGDFLMGTWWFTSGFGGIEFSKPDGFGLDPYWMVLISGKLLIPFAAIFLCQPGQPQPFLDPAWQVLLGSLRLLKDTTRSAFFLNCSTLFLGGMLQRQALRQTLRKLRFLNQVLGGPANLELSRFEDTLTRVLNIHGEKPHIYIHYIRLRYVTLRYITLHYIHTYTHTWCTLNSGCSANQRWCCWMLLTHWGGREILFYCARTDGVPMGSFDPKRSWDEAMMELISFAKEECTLPLFQIPMAMLLVRHG